MRVTGRILPGALRSASGRVWGLLAPLRGRVVLAVLADGALVLVQRALTPWTHAR